MYVSSSTVCSLTGIPLLHGQPAVAVAVRRYYNDPNAVDIFVLDSVKYMARGTFDSETEFLDDLESSSHPALLPWQVPYVHGSPMIPTVDPDRYTWSKSMHLLFFHGAAWDNVVQYHQQAKFDAYEDYRERREEYEQDAAMSGSLTLADWQERQYRGPAKIRWLSEPLHAEFASILVFCIHTRVPLFAYGDVHRHGFASDDLAQLHQVRSIILSQAQATFQQEASA